MDTSSINPVSVIDEAIDLSTRLAGTEFPISIFPAQIQRIIHEVWKRRARLTPSGTRDLTLRAK